MVYMDKPSHHWQQAVVNGAIRQDSSQERLLPVLDQVASSLNLPVHRVVWRGVEVWRGITNEIPATHGVYLYGDVGRGKSLLMQMIFDSVHTPAKRRVHFHSFMEELHQRLHHLKPPKNVDLILYLASQLSAEARLLCFDEFYITNIADGMFLGRLLSAFHQCGVTLCATSNWAPDHLFQDGVNRNQVMPFIASMTKRLHVCELGHGVDWRREFSNPEALAPTTAEGLFVSLTGTAPEPIAMQLRYTDVWLKGMMDGVYWFDFKALCSRALGRAEYITLCAHAKLVIISALPQLSIDGADTAMRFVVLVDILYEYRIPLKIYSEVQLEAACTEGPAAFAWRRSVSRIHELSRMVVVG